MARLELACVFVMGVAAVALAVVSARPAMGQQATNQASATQPGAGLLAFRERVSFHVYENHSDGAGGEQDALELAADNVFVYGVTGDFAVMAHLPVKVRWFDRGDESALRDSADVDGGLADWTLMGQWRFLRVDEVGINTSRYAMQFGVEGPSYNDGLSSESFDPFVGLSMTHIRGRHGFGGAVRYKVNTDSEPNPLGPGNGDSDLLTYDASYLYRLDPVAYTASTTASTYLQIEINSLYEMDGDRRTLLSPGLLFEAQTWAAEVSVQVPVDQRMTDSADLRFGLVAGMRLLF